MCYYLKKLAIASCFEKLTPLRENSENDPFTFVAIAGMA